MNSHTSSAICRLGAAAIAALVGTSAVAQAADYPSKPIELIVPFPPGGALDAMARQFAAALDVRLKRRTVVLNRDGSSTIIGMTALANAPADGHTVAFGPVTSLTIHPHRVKKLAFSRESFTPVCQTFENVFFVATGNSSKFGDLASVVRAAKEKPGALRYGHPGVASSPHLAGAELWQRAGVQLNDIPYRGEAPMVQQFNAGDLDVGIITMSLLSAQKLKPLAVFGDARMPNYPDVPTLDELGYKLHPSTYGGLFVRAGTPQAIVSQLEKACRDIVTAPDYRESALKLSQLPNFLARDAFAARIDADSRSKAALLPTLKLEE